MALEVPRSIRGGGTIAKLLFSHVFPARLGLLRRAGFTDFFQFVFQAAVAAGLYTLAIIGVLTSVIAAYYYIRIIKVMYFDESAAGAFDEAEDHSLNVILWAVSLALVFFIVLPGPLLTNAQAAAQSLLK